MNSVHEQCPNSDPKQCTVTKLGWVHNAHTQNPGRAHTARPVPMSWALLHAQQAGRAHVARTASTGRALSVRRSRAKRPGRGCKLRPLSLVHPQARSRHRSQVATSWTIKPGRDVNPMSRPPFCSTKTVQVATSKIGSRHQLPWESQNHVATSKRCRDTAQATPGRDLTSMSRLPFLCQAPGQVATSFPGRDLLNDQARSRHQPHVATSLPVLSH